MNVLDELYDIALEKDIDVEDFHFSETKKAMCMCTPERAAIALDKSVIESTAEEKVLFAEELGHYETGSMYYLEATMGTALYKDNVIWCEGRAKRYAIRKLIPLDALKDAFKQGYALCCELAECFNVTAEIVQSAIDYYTAQGEI